MPDIKKEGHVSGAFPELNQRSSKKTKILNPNKIPIRVFLGSNDEGTIQKVESALLRLLEVYEFKIVDEDEPQYGSWWKKLIACAQNDKTQKALREKLEKIEKALELEKIGKAKSVINKNEAEAASILIESIKSESEAVIQVGSLLILKYTKPSGYSQTLVKNLSDRELSAVDDFPEILKNPATLFKQIERIISAGYHAKKALDEIIIDMTPETSEPKPELEEVKVRFTDGTSKKFKLPKGSFKKSSLSNERINIDK